jgi:two-component system sensor histidine kinase YesM
MSRLPAKKYFHRVLGLFLAAAFLPVLLLSFSLTGIASRALLRASEERGREAAAAFAAGFRGLAEGVDKSLVLIGSAPETRAILASRGRGDKSALSAPGRLLALEASREGGLAYALVGAGGSLSLSTRALPEDWEPRVYGNWGIFREAQASRATVFEARRRLTEKGDAALIVAARALRGREGEIEGYALAEIDRSALVRAAKAGGFGLTADFELLSPSRLVAFSLADGSREGHFEDELAPRSPGGAEGGVYEVLGTGGFTARAILPSSLLADLSHAMNRATLAGLALSALLALALAFLASRIVTKPVYAISEAMGRLRSGDLSARLAPNSNDELGDLVRSFNATAEELGELMDRAVEDQELLRGAELRSLAARMNPHFLYNSLNSIRSLAKLGRDGEIVEVVTRLGKILRASASDREELSTVGEGLALVRDYLAVEKIRFGERFIFREEIDASILGCELPSLCLEPLAENALTHGLEQKRGPGSLRIEGKREGGSAIVAFEDDGPGMAEGELQRLARLLESGELPPPAGASSAAGEGQERGAGMGLGLAATNRRLRLYYGEGGGLRVAAGPGGSGFRVELRVPLKGGTA